MNFQSSFWKGFAGAAVALVLGFLSWHAYIDHQNFHAIVNMINANAAKQAHGNSPGTP